MPNEDRSVFKCKHGDHKNTLEQRLALISIGNKSRGNDAIASVLCEKIIDDRPENICWFDLGSYTNYLSDCIKSHAAAIIVDAVKVKNAVGRALITDLIPVINGSATLSIQSSHGFSFIDEIRFAKKNSFIPDKIMFFGIEIEAEEISWGENLDSQLNDKVPELTEQLRVLIKSVQEEIICTKQA